MPEYLTPWQLAALLKANPDAFRDWLKREKDRGRDHTAPPEHWVSPDRRTYNRDTVIAAWRARPGKGGRPRTKN